MPVLRLEALEYATLNLIQLSKPDMLLGVELVEEEQLACFPLLVHTCRLEYNMPGKKRLYTLYELDSKGKMSRVSPLAFHKQAAVRVFQNRLLDGFFKGKHSELRPLTKTQMAERS